MDSKPSNPLSKHFRQPAIYLKLPSKGEYWPEDAIRMPANGEVAIYPMTTKDEITLRTPDALLNGSGVVSVIQSCCPEIIDAWRMPSIDVDAVIIAIRIASYGHKMPFTSICPGCNTSHEYAIDLQPLLDGIRMPNFLEPVKVNNLIIKLHPQPYFSLSKTNQSGFEEEKLLQAIQNSALSEELRDIEISKQMQKLIDLSILTLTSGTEYIQIEDNLRVDNKDFLKEFYENSGAEVIRTIQERFSDLSNQGSIQPVPVTCEDCNHEFRIQLTFDYSSFFAKGF